MNAEQLETIINRIAAVGEGPPLISFLCSLERDELREVGAAIGAADQKAAMQHDLIVIVAAKVRDKIATKQPLWTKPAPESKPRTHRYIPQLRPASFATVPHGWRYVEAPPGVIASQRPDLPASQHAHGIIEYDAPLTPEQIHIFDLLPVVPVPHQGLVYQLSLKFGERMAALEAAFDDAMYRDGYTRDEVAAAVVKVREQLAPAVALVAEQRDRALALLVIARKALEVDEPRLLHRGITKRAIDATAEVADAPLVCPDCEHVAPDVGALLDHLDACPVRRGEVRP